MILNSAEEIRQIYATGQGSIKLRGTYEPHPDRHNAVLITSIPYGIEKDALVERIGELIGKGQVPQLVNVKDLSTDDIRIVLELRPGSSPDAALAYLFKNTPLQVNYNVNLTCLLPAAGAEVAVPSRLDLTSILQHFLDFRMDVVVRRLRFELKNLLERIHILEGFAIVFKNLDEAIQIIRNSDGKADAAPKLIRRFELSEIQADAVLETKLYKLGKLEIRDILDELKQKRKRAAEIKLLLDDEPARWEIIKSELKQINKTFGEPRRTSIETPTAPMEFREEDYIVDEDAWVIVTREGWTKRQRSFTDVASIRLRDNDTVGWVYRARAGRPSPFSPIEESPTLCGSTTSRSQPAMASRFRNNLLSRTRSTSSGSFATIHAVYPIPASTPRLHRAWCSGCSTSMRMRMATRRMERSPAATATQTATARLRRYPRLPTPLP